MTKKETRSVQGAVLRARAEEKAREKAGRMEAKIEARAPEETRRLLHELRVHQIEVEMQNEELRRSQVELGASQARYYDLYDLAPVGYFVLSEEGLILEANLTVATLLGVARGALVKQPFSRFILPEDQDIYYRHRQQLFKTGAPQIGEMRMLGKDGAPFWARVEAAAAQDAEGTPVCRAVLSDITERKRVEEARRTSQQILEGIINAIPVRVFWKDRNLVYLGCNAIFARDAGFSDPEDIIGKDDYQMGWRDQAELYRADDRQIIESGRAKLLIEEPQTTPEGNTITLLTNKLPLRSSTGDISGVLGTYMDITERKRAEEKAEKISRWQIGVNLLQQSLLEASPLEDKLRTVTESIVRIFDADFCRIWLIRPGDLCEQDCVHARLKTGPHVCRHRDRCLHLLASSDRYTHTDGETHRRVPFGCYKIGRVASGEDHKFLTNDAQNDPRVHHHEWTRELELVSFAGYQLRIPGGETLGVLALFAKHPLPEAEDAMLDGLSSSLALIIQQSDMAASLKQSEEKHRSLIKAVVDPIIMMNTRGDVLLCNDAGMALFNRPENEILNQNILKLLPAKSTATWRAAMEKTITSRTSTVLVHWINERYFESVFAPVTDPEKRIFAVTVVARDLTDHKLDEEEIEKLARFPSENPNPVLRVSAEGTIIYSNNAGEKLLKEWRCRIGEALPEEWRDKVRQISHSGTVTETVIECGDKAFLLIFYPVTESGYINIYGTDITERKKAEEALQQSEAQLRQAQKMEAIGRLAGGIAHDFNNLLTAISGFSDLTLSQLPEGTPMYDDIETIKKAAFRAAALTRQLLAFSRQQALQPQIINLNETISNLDKMLRRIIGEDIEIVTRPAEKIPRVKADPGQIEQVIMNLVVNARDAMPDGGIITIATENVSLDRDAAAIIPESHPGHFVRLSLEDTGTGIDPQVIEHIFEPFFTTKKTGEGTGLGLSTIYGIVKQHQGWINVHSQPGQGSVFNVYLPAFHVGTDWETEETDSRKPPRGAGEKILVVEDEKSVRNFISRALRQYGYVVLTADTIAEGKKIFNEQPGGIDLLFTDIMLTDGSGLSLAYQLRGRHPGLAILLCSGYSDGNFKWTAEDKETFRLLQKPCALYDLLCAVKDVLRERAEKPAENDAVNKS